MTDAGANNEDNPTGDDVESPAANNDPETIESDDEAALVELFDLDDLNGITSVEVEDIDDTTNKPTGIELYLERLDKLRVRPAPEPETTMHWALMILLAIIATVVTGAGIMISLDVLTADEFTDLAPVILTPLFTLAGTALAFYRRR